MDIKEALDQMEQICTQFIREIKSLMTFIIKTEDEVKKMGEMKADLEKAISDIHSEYSQTQEKYQNLSTALSENYEKQKQNSKEGLKNLKEQSAKELNEMNSVKEAKLAQLNKTISELQAKEGELKDRISEKEKLLLSLNQSIESIKTRLTA